MARTWYYVNEDDQEVGPIDSGTIRQLVNDGIVTRQTMIWRDDLPDWIEAGRMRKLFAASSTDGSRRAESLQQDRPRRVERREVDLSNADDDWTSLVDPEPIADDDPFAYHDDSGQVLRSFSRPEPKQYDSADYDTAEPEEVGYSGPIRSVGAADEAQYASAIARFGARFIDSILFIFGFIVVSVAASLVFLEGQAGPVADESIGWFLATIFGYVIVSMLVVIPLQNCSHHQASWGKRVTGIVVTDLEGNRITFGQALGRELAQGLFGFVPFLSIVNIVVHFFDEQKQCLHDKMANTLVMARR